MTVVRSHSSPNCDPRPAGEPCSLVVIHAISLPPNRLGGAGVEQLFTNTLNPNEHPYFATIAHLRVSAHFFIRRTGETICFVAPELRAWHAGVSSWRGHERCNDFSIGIELEGCDTLPFEPVQYEVLAALLADLCERFPIEGITGHSDIAPGRKTDPGPMFAWGRLKRILEARHGARLAGLIEPEAEVPEDEPQRMAWPFPLGERPE
ncbi:1,6-anhydro-N-acetylmuramyl-L-alanine amidase AmpD [Zoogloea dura]|uniref:1,6-anhydro-N-acetylmuramyl-L-alanine amidase AmpD n=1 Tax=Zoogloea dura TaxID=2728840 RepID=A0A848G465_9RHOO|nr:1,6-anhydro-N-acetylmuramyl-L-alanine amidase AmpD [Zoogloea dura]NML26044.1 1,6-anhydro-N-acetylmuramyl-L-alanine amidase AmpD [Zoogloea dura]